MALILAAVFVNGWTDAPNAIATAVSSRALRPGRAMRLAAAFNFLGVLVMTLLNARVAETISGIVDFGDTGETPAVALAAALAAIVVWAVAAWAFGIPTSESHALVAGLTGAAAALGGLKSVNADAWGKVLAGLAVSSVFGFLAGFFAAKLAGRLARPAGRRAADRLLMRGQAAAACGMAFLHGAQDGQKFLGVFMLGLYLNGHASRGADGAFDIPLGAMALCALVMGLGTAVGGGRIIKSVGVDMVRLSPYQGFASDAAAGALMLAASLAGVPVSTTHTKTTAMLGAGAAERPRSVNWGVARDMGIAWCLTFPGCGAVGYLTARLFLFLF